MNQGILPRAVLLSVLLTSALHADPLHPLAADAYWHHESNFIFPATLGGLARIGAPQDVDGSTTIDAYYGGGETERWLVIKIELFPANTGTADFTGAIAVNTIDLGSGRGTARRATFLATHNEVIYDIEHGGWRMMVRARLLEDTDAAHIEQFVRALPIERLGEIDTRCPNPGCGEATSPPTSR